MTMRHLLSQEPMTFNELLDLFEAYVSTIGGPINKGHDMLREEIGAGEHVALGHIFGVAYEAEDMAKRLCQIRATQNTNTDVSITLAGDIAQKVERTAEDVLYLLSEAAAVFDLLRSGITGGFLSGDDNGVLSVMG